MTRENRDTEIEGEGNVVPLASEYRAVTRGIQWLKHNPDGSTECRQITNFVAKIHESVTIDDGSGEAAARYEVKSRCEGVHRTFTVPAERFEAMAWTHEISPRAHVVPGHLHSSRAAVAIREDVRQAIIDTVPMKRLGKPEEIGALVAYLSSELAGYMSGATLNINGGLHMG